MGGQKDERVGGSVCGALGGDTKGRPFQILGTHTSAFCRQHQALGSENPRLSDLECLSQNIRTPYTGEHARAGQRERWINLPTKGLASSYELLIVLSSQSPKPDPQHRLSGVK